MNNLFARSIVSCRERFRILFTIAASICFLFPTPAHGHTESTRQNVFQLRNCIDDHCFCTGSENKNWKEAQVVDVERFFSSGDNSLQKSFMVGKNAKPINVDISLRMEGTKMSEKSSQSQSLLSRLYCTSTCSSSAECAGVFVDKNGTEKCLQVPKMDLERVLDEVVLLKMVLGVKMNGLMLPCSFYTKEVLMKKVDPEDTILDKHGCPYLKVAKEKLRENSNDDPDEWLIIQRRIDDSLDFRLGWDEYKKGFGDVKRNFWLGLEEMHRLTRDGEFELKMETFVTEDYERNLCSQVTYKHEEFETVVIGPESEGYKLNLITSKDRKWGLKVHNGARFQTQDRLNPDIENQMKHTTTGWWCSNYESYEGNRDISSLYVGLENGFELAAFIQLKIRKKTQRR